MMTASAKIVIITGRTMIAGPTAKIKDLNRSKT